MGKDTENHKRVKEERPGQSEASAQTYPQPPLPSPPFPLPTPTTFFLMFNKMKNLKIKLNTTQTAHYHLKGSWLQNLLDNTKKTKKWGVRNIAPSTL